MLRASALTRNVGPALPMPSKVMARESPVVAGSPRELTAVASGSPRKTQLPA
jgi:hypothetical protein